MGDLTYDVIVLGAGPVGENVADRAVRGGLSVAIVERELVGGECSYWACMPTKALLRDAAALRAARALPAAGASITGPLDPSLVLARRDAFASDWHDDGQVAWLDSAGIDLVRGHARLDGVRRVAVTRADGSVSVLRARHAVVVATGSSPLMPPIPGLVEASPWTSREAASAHEVPGRLAIVGGGVVGSEMATAYAALGASVTLVSLTRLLPGVEEFASAQVTAALREAGVDVRTDVAVTGARRSDAGVTLTLADGASVEADEVLIAAGRVANTRDLGLETVGLTPGQWLRTGDDLAVQDGWLYAAGDVNQRILLTHHGKYQARALGDAIAARARGEVVDTSAWGRHAATADVEAAAQVIFTDPEVASVGLTAAAATARGRRVRVVDHDLGAVAGASLHADGYAGRARLVIDDDRDVVLGFTVVGPDVAELLHAATVAVAGEVPIARLWHAVPAYPTMSEVWLRLLEADGRDR